MTEDLISRPRIFKAPPLDEELLGAIKLISPHLELGRDEASRALWEQDQNGACWGEFLALERLLSPLAPEKVLEIGPGLGRSTAFFVKRLGWERAEFHLYESDGSEARYGLLEPKRNDSFCGSISALKRTLAYNGIENFKIFDAKELDFRLRSLPGPYGLIYSFYSVGFHWSLEHFLEDILSLMREGSLGIFTVPGDFRGFPGLGPLKHEVLEWTAAWPKDYPHKLLVLEKIGD